jgi:hypothetical protein
MLLPCHRQCNCIVCRWGSVFAGFRGFCFLALIPSPKEEVVAQENVLRVIDALG